MDSEIQEIREKIDELAELQKENGRMLKSLYKRAQWASVLVVVKWTAFAILTIGSLYFIQPYLDTLFKTYGAISGIGGGSKNANQAGSSSNSVLDLIKSL